MKKLPLKALINRDKLQYFYFFLIIETIAAITFLIIDISRKGGPLYSLSLNPFTQFDDYFVHFGLASFPTGTNIYEITDMACFPPFAYLMYLFLARVSGYATTDPMNTTPAQNFGINLTVYLIYTIVCVILILYAVSLYVKKKGFVYQVLFPTLLVISYPFAFTTFQRGNSVILVAALVSIAAAWRNDESRFKREMALILIAFSFGLKIYPAVFGLMYLKEKHFFAAIRLTIYGAVVFFVPFIFFGGIDGLKTLLNTLLTLNGSVHRCTVSGLVNEITSNIFGYSIHGFTVFIQQLFLILSVIAFFLTREKWGEILILCGLMAVYISSSWNYTCIYMLPALLAFLAEKGFEPIRIKKKDWFHLVVFILFLIAFSIPYPLGGELIFDSIVIIEFAYIIKTIAVNAFNLMYKSMEKKSA